VGDRLLAGLRDLATRQPLIGDVRGRGLMIGFDVTDHDTAEALEQACFQRGLLVLTCGRKGIRLAPPLVVNDAQADTALTIVAEACDSLTK
jgi:4-aminobutyrate aminotransferase